MKLKLYNRDEIFIIDVDSVIYFKAEDHYTSVYYSKDIRQLLPFGLSQLENTISAQDGCASRFMRVGRSHLLNLSKIVHASVTKETVTMLTTVGMFVTIHISRSVIRELARCLRCEDDGETVANIRGGGNFQSPYLSQLMRNVRLNRVLAWRHLELNAIFKNTNFVLNEAKYN